MRVFWSILLVLALSVAACAQTTTSSAQVPRLVRFSGTLSLADTSATSVGITFALYGAQTGGSPLWLETQNVSVDAQGNYSILLGSASKDGIPADLFLTNEARWLGVKPEGLDEQPRVLLVSVPYALKAGDAETLGGKPASAFVMNTSSANSGPTLQSRAVAASAPVSSLASTGTANFIAKFTDNSGNLGNSLLFDTGTGVGINRTNPLATLDVNGNSIFTGNSTFNGLATFRNFATLFTTTDTFGPQFAFTNQASPTPASWRFGIPGFVNATSFFIFDYVNQNAPITIEKGAGANALYLKSGGNVGIGTAAPNNKLSVGGVIESTTGGFKFPDGSTLASATTQGTSSFTGNTVNQILAVTQNGTGTAANFTASNATQSVGVTQNGAGVVQLVSSGIPSGLRGDSTTTSGNAAGVLGTSASYSGYGVLGINLADCPPAPAPPTPDPCNSVGTYGWSVNARHGTGVWGEAESTVTGADNVGVYGQALGDTGTGVFGYAKSSVTGSDGVGVYGATEAPKGTGVFGQANSTTGTTAGLYGVVFSTSGAGAQLDVVTGANVLVGRSGTAPTYNNVFRVDSTGKGFFNGGTQNSGADFAESVDVIGGASKYQPGDVLMVDESGVRRFALTTEAYSTKIAGIYSTKPGVLGTTHMDGDPRLANEVPLAIVGIVPCKVSAENGPIKAGDLLVSSSKPGYAMKGTDRQKMFGAVVGKALGSLDKDTGVIEVLVSLH